MVQCIRQLSVRQLSNEWTLVFDGGKKEANARVTLLTKLSTTHACNDANCGKRDRALIENHSSARQLALQIPHLQNFPAPKLTARKRCQLKSWLHSFSSSHNNRQTSTLVLLLACDRTFVRSSLRESFRATDSLQWAKFDTSIDVTGAIQSVSLGPNNFPSDGAWLVRESIGQWNCVTLVW